MMELRPELNFRDLGGLPGAGGRTIRSGFFFRSGGPYHWTEEERAAVASMHIRFVLDLRTEAEAAKKPDPALPGATTLRYSGVVSRGGEEIDFSPRGMHQIGTDARHQYKALLAYYREMPFANEAFHVLVEAVRREEVPLLFHCATGKDRTGVAAMVLLLLLGTDEKTILNDYLLSNQYRHQNIENSLRGHAQEIQEHPELKPLLLMQEGVLPEVGEAVLAEIHARCGSGENYIMNEYGLSSADIAALRSRYLF